MSTTLAALALGAAAAGMNMSSQQSAARTQQKYTRENMQRAHEYQKELMRLSTPYAVQGMRDAGLSVAGFNGPASVPSEPSAPMGAKPDAFDPTGLINSGISAVRAQADTRLVNAQADKAEQEAAQLKHANSGTGNNLVQVMTDRLNAMRAAGLNEKDLQGLQDRIDAIKAHPELYNLGDLEGYQKALEVDSHSFKKLSETIEETAKQVNGIYELRNKPTLRFELAKQQLQLQAAQAALLGSQKDLNKENIDKVKKDIELIDKTKLKLDQEISNLEKQGILTSQESEQLRNNDIKTLLEHGEYGDAFRAFLIDHGTDLLKTYMMARGIGGLASGGASLLKNGAKNVIKPLTTKPTKIEFNPDQVHTPLGNLGKVRLKHHSPFKDNTADDNIFKMLVVRKGESAARSLYADWLKNRAKGQSFNDFYHKIWLKEMHNLYNLY